MNITDNFRKKYSFLIVPAFSVIYLLFENFITGIRTDHFVLLGIIISCYYISSFTRRLITGLAIIIVYWILYDSMKAWPNWAYRNVDIASLYNLEKSIFGITDGNTIVTANEYFLNHNNTFIDVVCGIFYLNWMPLPLFFAFYLYFKNKNLFLRFCMAFFFVNCIGFVIYYLHPAAPPWYYEKYGSVLDTSTKSYAAGLLRFDQYFGIHLFEGLYAKGSNVFAAMPSLHASYPLIGLIYALKQPARWLRFLFATIMIGIWFSAVYLSHHYILDVLAGICCGLVGVYFFETFLLRNKLFNKFINYYESSI